MLPWPRSPLALVLRHIETAEKRPQGLLDAYVAMIPKAEGDSTPLGQRSLCVHLVVYRLQASVRLAHIQDRFYSWVPDSVFSAGRGVSSVDAWYSTTIDIEEVLVAHVVKSFDTVDRDILVCALGRHGLQVWFRKVFFSLFRKVRLRFILAARLRVAWTGDGSILKYALSMVIIVALYGPWCRHLESLKGMFPQLYADNLKCHSYNVDTLLAAAQDMVSYVKVVVKVYFLAPLGSPAGA